MLSGTSGTKWRKLGCAAPNWHRRRHHLSQSIHRPPSVGGLFLFLRLNFLEQVPLYGNVPPEIGVEVLHEGWPVRRTLRGPISAIADGYQRLSPLRPDPRWGRWTHEIARRLAGGARAGESFPKGKKPLRRAAEGPRPALGYAQASADSPAGLTPTAQNCSRMKIKWLGLLRRAD